MGMTDEGEGGDGLSGQLDRYAELLVRAGVDVQPGQELVVTCPVEAAPFCRRVVRAGYEAGAVRVTVDWTDDAVTRQTLERVPMGLLSTTPSWRRALLEDTAAAGACYLYLEGEDPDALAGVDPARPAAVRKARNTECLGWRRGMDFGRNAWCIAGVPTAAWARAVFPQVARERGDDAAVLALWRAVLAAARADGPDPLGAWELHDREFDANLDRLNGHRFDRLVYRSSNGTDLTVGLTPRHVWAGGSARTTAPDAGGTRFGGARYFPNVPTEEVFTSPDRLRVDGVVRAVLPLVHAGSVVRDLWLRFEAGRVVEFGAAQGREVVERILETDEGARRLGECALISKDTPIRRSGLLFYSTLYDENASCHLALGAGFPECYEGGEGMDIASLERAGVNHSATHVDFMIGADDLSVVGITAGGDRVSVFEDGTWAW
ncbi:MAG: aminopeptidase [Coriobacteriales bacterium]|jgi:aminopeptidase